MNNIIWLLLAHYIADFPLQGDFLAQNKGNNWYCLFAHSMIYGLTISFCLSLMGKFEPWKAFVLVLSHIIIDWLKANAKDKSKAMTTHLYYDQLAHILINTRLLNM